MSAVDVLPCMTPRNTLFVCHQDPNALKLSLPEGIMITSRVLRRSEEQVSGDRFETSEFMQQVFDDGSIGELCAGCQLQQLMLLARFQGVQLR